MKMECTKLESKKPTTEYLVLYSWLKKIFNLGLVHAISVKTE